MALTEAPGRATRAVETSTAPERGPLVLLALILVAAVAT